MRAYAIGIEIETDDQAVLACLAFHNRLPAMLEADRLSDPDGRQYPRSFTGWTAGEWMYVAAHFRNYGAAQDNGYALLAVDLRVYSRKQAAQIVTAWCGAARAEEGPWALEVIDNAPVSAN